MNFRLIVILTTLFLTACASKDVVEDFNDFPSTASGDSPPVLYVWESLPGDSPNRLTRNERFPHGFDYKIATNTLEIKDSKQSMARRIVGLLNVPETGNYKFYLSADHSAEVWLSSDSNPINKRLVSMTNRPTGYLVFDKYSSQTSPSIPLEAGKPYFFEVLHKTHKNEDYLNVSWSGPGFSRTTLNSVSLSEYKKEQVDFEALYQEGYHVGYEAGRYLSPYDLTYPIPDSDGDGLPDFYENILGLNINDASDALSDLDEDLLTVLDEYLLRTNPNDTDSDNDGIPDGFEVIHSLDPNNINDAYEDIDGDGYTNIQEYSAGSLLSDSNDVPDTIRNISLSWDTPSTRSDGSSLGASDIQEYRIYAGATNEELSLLETVSDPSVTNISLTVDKELLYFSISTVTVDGIEGSKSSLISLN